jgi:pyruvate dehydrogenase E2 component (dihydrolipoamide acetyltransferase)
MAKVIDMPKLSPTMEEGELSQWHKNEGDIVDIDDLLADVETDKATMEFRSFDKGVLLKILVPAGKTVLLGQPVAIIGESGENIDAFLASLSSGGEASQPAAKPPAKTPEVAAEPAVEPAIANVPPAQRPTTNLGYDDEDETTIVHSVVSRGRVKASPYVRKLARERNLDLRVIPGTGPHGRIIARDVERIPEARPTVKHAVSLADELLPAALATPAESPGRPEGEVRPLSRMRKTIARRLTESKQTVPHFYLTIDVDAEALVALRAQINGELALGASKDQPVDKVSINDLLIKACGVALKRVPECNAQFTPDALIFHRRVDISVAVSVPDGLVTPVVRNADSKSIVAISREVKDLAKRAQQKKLAPEEMTDGTFSISNLGMFGIDSFSAVINPPEGAILAVGQARDVPVVKDGAVVPGKMLAMTLSCDHRVIDGAVGARFLAEVRRLLERPMQLLVC